MMWREEEDYIVRFLDTPEQDLLQGRAIAYFY